MFVFGSGGALVGADLRQRQRAHVGAGSVAAVPVDDLVDGLFEARD